MASEARQKMSAERLEELKKELDYLENVREKEVAEQLKVARSYGDLSENSEYDEAKNEQGKLYSRIAEVRRLIENAEIVENTTRADQVGIGSYVTILDVEFDEKCTYRIVGSQEANPMEGKISDDSPVGRALMGHKKGDTVFAETGDARTELKILKISRK
ncbi:MAG: transcription elongation factor GreA [Oscillospiraceae bacterium]|nr:transcription elongation factor GreA [Oscillospiraceae bacterium]